jgi:hypothetical protein
MKQPAINSDGSCPECVKRCGSCAWHQADGLRRDRANMANLARIVASAKHQTLLRICARHELESDEGGTAMKKAERIYKAQGHAAS